MASDPAVVLPVRRAFVLCRSVRLRCEPLLPSCAALTPRGRTDLRGPSTSPLSPSQLRARAGDCARSERGTARAPSRAESRVDPHSRSADRRRLAARSRLVSVVHAGLRLGDRRPSHAHAVSAKRARPIRHDVSRVDDVAAGRLGTSAAQLRGARPSSWPFGRLVAPARIGDRARREAGGGAHAVGVGHGRVVVVGVGLAAVRAGAARAGASAAIESSGVVGPGLARWRAGIEQREQREWIGADAGRVDDARVRARARRQDRRRITAVRRTDRAGSECMGRTTGAACIPDAAAAGERGRAEDTVESAAEPRR